MVKRVVAALLWFYAVWVLWNIAAFAEGWSIFFGPVIAAIASLIIATDPMHKLWTPRVSTPSIDPRLQSLQVRS